MLGHKRICFVFNMFFIFLYCEFCIDLCDLCIHNWISTVQFNIKYRNLVSPVSRIYFIWLETAATLSGDDGYHDGEEDGHEGQCCGSH